MAYILFDGISPYNNGKVDWDVYEDIRDSFDYSSEYNPFDGGFIYYDEDEFEDSDFDEEPTDEEIMAEEGVDI